MPKNPNPETHEFGPFRYDVAHHTLLRGGDTVPLEPKLAGTLEALLEHRGEIVDKGQLIRRVWPDCKVEEGGLARNISLLRKVLDDDEGVYIETVPKRGYRFAPSTGGKPRSRSRRRNWLVVATSVLACAALLYWQFYIPSAYVGGSGGSALLAVLPVECLTPELERSGFSTGFNEVLLTEMAASGAVRLVSSSTVRRYAQLGVPANVMARLLGVEVLVEGTAERSDGRLRISLRLSDVRSGRLIWAEAFERPAADVLQAQAEVARAAADSITGRLRR